ncbi:hypothetical protein EVAR_25231_1 [Eumeta japonica]|uniref:Uncharacterized protein n=1 Tax=Eumeta variegata TaxID=151549 RepID=A0A4C1WK88_EUMVA|nr:hypothetical protein EVAR_25231_1 [Eumeta japonica]
MSGWCVEVGYCMIYDRKLGEDLDQIHAMRRSRNDLGADFVTAHRVGHVVKLVESGSNRRGRTAPCAAD